jgi:hypothetical protein
MCSTGGAVRWQHVQGAARQERLQLGCQAERVCAGVGLRECRKVAFIVVPHVTDSPFRLVSTRHSVIICASVHSIVYTEKQWLQHG